MTPELNSKHRPTPGSTTESLSRFEQKSVLISGGTSGIGLEAVRFCSRNGHNVATIGRNEDRLALLRQELPEVLATQLDLLAITPPTEEELSCNLEQIFPFPKFAALVRNTAHRFGKIDAVILNAGITGLRPGSPIEPGLWVQSALAQFFATAPYLARSNGSFVLISSPLVYQAADLRAAGGVPKEIQPYIEAKSAMETWLRRAASWANAELGWSKVFYIDPGSVDTMMHQEVLEFGSSQLRDRTMQKRLSGELRDPTSVAQVIVQMALTGCMFNSETRSFDIPIHSGSRISISQEALKLAR